MVNKNTLGIIFPNTYDDLIPELVHRRTMASVPFGGRYRMIDFTLSAMVNAGIDNVTVLAKKNYYSLMDHLGNGREWDLSRKLGGLNMVPPFTQSNTKCTMAVWRPLPPFSAIWRRRRKNMSSCPTATSPRTLTMPI